MSLLDLSNSIITIISFIVNLCFLMPLMCKIYKYFTRNRYIKKVLAYNSNLIQIYQSTFEFNVVDGSKYNLIKCSALEEIHGIINIFDYKIQKFAFVNQDDNGRNEMCIGGGFYNKRTNFYFVKYFSNFISYIDMKYKNKLENAHIDTRMVEYSENKFGFKIDEELFLETEEYIKDYVFFIKLTPNDFNNENKKVVHILFGGTYMGTIKATEYLKTHCKEIYKKFKNDHYFFALELDLMANCFDQRVGIIDLTNKMFTP